MTDTLSPQEARAIFENCPLPAVVLDAQGTIVGINDAFSDLAGPSQTRDLTGKMVSSLTNPVLKQLLSEYPRLDWEDSTGRVRNIYIQRVMLSGDTSKEVRFFIDRSERVRLESANTILEQKLQQNLLTDPLTGLLNHRGIVLALEPQIARCRRYNNTLSVVMMAVDAPIDREKLLVEVAHLLKDQLRWADLIGCTDGQEFMLALPETPETAALQLANKLTPLLEKNTQGELAGISVWSCFGIAGWRKTDNAATILQRAANALAKARNSDTSKSVAL